MKQNELNKILELHKLWLEDNSKGERADLQRANLQGADLQGANLRYANLQDANLQDANLQGANLRDADLRYADLRGANLRGADLQRANLRYADLQRANLRYANLDFSCLPLWCGGLDFKIDEKQAKQLMYHVINLMQYSDLDTSKIVKKQMYKWLEYSHVVTEHGLEKLKGEKE